MSSVGKEALNRYNSRRQSQQGLHPFNNTSEQRRQSQLPEPRLHSFKPTKPEDKVYTIDDIQLDFVQMFSPNEQVAFYTSNLEKMNRPNYENPQMLTIARNKDVSMKELAKNGWVSEELREIYIKRLVNVLEVPENVTLDTYGIDSDHKLIQFYEDNLFNLDYGSRSTSYFRLSPMISIPIRYIPEQTKGYFIRQTEIELSHLIEKMMVNRTYSHGLNFNLNGLESPNDLAKFYALQLFRLDNNGYTNPLTIVNISTKELVLFSKLNDEDKGNLVDKYVTGFLEVLKRYEELKLDTSEIGSKEVKEQFYHNNMCTLIKSKPSDYFRLSPTILIRMMYILKVDGCKKYFIDIVRNEINYNGWKFDINRCP